MKKIFIILFIFSFYSTNVYSETDCSKIKKLSKEYLNCLTKKSKEKTTDLGLDTSNIKEKKYISDWFKKKK
tara:strand:+ start:966 stop:1178 length:213 start_codon:yes stop_codon:yes gene_type:complete